MIIIKNLVFKLLDELEPNELLEVKFQKSYQSIYLTNKQSILPLALEIRSYYNDVDRPLEMAYRAAFGDGIPENNVNEYEAQYVLDHIVLFNEKKYLITEELLDIEYQEDYFAITISNLDGISTNYYKYSDIYSIRIMHESNNPVVKEYNLLNYKYQSNK